MNEAKRIVLIFFFIFSCSGLSGQASLQSQIAHIDSLILSTKSQDSIQTLLQQQKSLAEELGDKRKQAEIEIKWGNASDYEGYAMEGHYLNALSLYRSLEDTAGILRATYEIANAKQLQNDYDSTRYYSERVFELANIVSDTSYVIKARLMLSSVYNHLSLYAKSLQELNASKVLAEGLHDQESVLMDILNKESFAYYSIEAYDKSAEDINRILEILKKDGDPRRLNIWSNNLASVYSLCDCVSFERRKEILKASIKYAESADFVYGKAFAYKHLADVYRGEGLYDSTRYFLEQIEVLLPEINKRDFTGLVSVAQGVYWIRMENKDKALSYYIKAYDIWKEIGSQKDQMEMASNISSIYSGKNDYEKAYKYLKDYVSLKDSLFNRDNIRKIKELELSYDFRQKQITDSLKNEERLNLISMEYEYEASIQKRSKVILIIIVISFFVIAWVIYVSYRRQKGLAQLLKVKSAQVESELHQKELLLTEIHHRVKNNFQILSSLLELQSRGANDQATRDLISEGKSRVKSMALIHNQLYKTDGLKVRLADYLKNLVAEVQRSFEASQSQIEINVDPKYEVDVDNMVPLGLIANEMLTNAYKYASAKPLKMEIRLSHDNGFELLEFKDNGPGLPVGFDLAKTKSTGLWLVSRLALQLHGRYEYAYEEGAVFRIYFSQSEFVTA